MRRSTDELKCLRLRATALRTAQAQGEDVSEKLEEVEARIGDLLLRESPIPLWLCVALAIPFGVCAALPVWLGYGAYVRHSWILALPLLLAAGNLALLLWAGLVVVLRRFRGVPIRRFLLPVNRLVGANILFLICTGVGWSAGLRARESHCRHICGACDRLIEEIDTYRSQEGSYPLSLGQVPGIKEVLKNPSFTVREGKHHEGGIDVRSVEEADATFYLDHDGYLCLVPIEHKFPLSFTKFYAYVRSSVAQSWKKDSLTWHLK